MADPSPSSPESPSPKYYRAFALILVVLLLVLFLRMVAGLLMAVILGVILSAMTRGVFNWFLKITHGKRSASAGLAVLANILFIVVPLGILAALMAADAVNLANQASDWFQPYRPQIESTLDKLTAGGSISLFGYEFQASDITDKLQESVGGITKFLLALLQRTAGGLAGVILLIFVALYTLYYVYLDGEQFWEWLKGMLPLKPEQSDRMRRDFLATSRASLKTLGVIGVVQGTMGGIGFWICGIPGVLFWSILMAIASVIPLVGAHIILIPASILLMLMGKLWYGVGLLLWSILAIANIDNFMRPLLIRKQTEMHSLVVFLSTLGGLAMFGFFGFLIGPVIAALLKVSFDIYAESEEAA